MKTIISLALKDLRLLSRDKFGLFWLLVFPLMMALFFGSIFSSGSGGGSSMKVVVVDQEKSESSQAFVDRLDSSSAIRVVTTTEDSARIMVRQGKAVAYIIVLPGFGKIENMFSGDSSATLAVGMDPSRKAESGYLRGLIMEAWFSQIQTLFTSPSLARSKVQEIMGMVNTDSSRGPVNGGPLLRLLGEVDLFLSESDSGAISSETESSSTEGFMKGPKIRHEEVTIASIGPRSSWEITFPQALLWALIGCTAAFAITIVTERTSGTLDRLLLSPMSRAHLLAGKGLACFITAVTVCVMLLAFGVLVFGVRTPNLVTLAVAIFSTAICFVGLMMLMSVMGKTEQAVAGAGWAILLAFSMTGGGMVPLMAMPKWMLTISHISPVKWGIYALEGAIWRGFGFSEMLLPISVLLGTGIVTFTAGVIIFKKTT